MSQINVFAVFNKNAFRIVTVGTRSYCRGILRNSYADYVNSKDGYTFNKRMVLRKISLSPTKTNRGILMFTVQEKSSGTIVHYGTKNSCSTFINSRDGYTLNKGYYTINTIRDTLNRVNREETLEARKVHTRNNRKITA